jgi:hypothetical protein
VRRDIVGPKCPTPDEVLEYSQEKIDQFAKHFEGLWFTGEVSALYVQKNGEDPR